MKILNVTFNPFFPIVIARLENFEMFPGFFGTLIISKKGAVWPFLSPFF